MIDNIVFYGKMGSGKTIAAEYLVDEFDYIKQSIAQGLKNAAVCIWGPEVLINRDKLQKLGKALRNIDSNSLIDGFIKRIDPELSIVSDDLRYPNEWWKLKEFGFIFIQVTAPDGMRTDRLQRNGKLDDISQLQDETETALDDAEFEPDYVISNAGNVEEFYNSIDNVMHKIEGRS